MKLLRLDINSEFGSIKQGFSLKFRNPFDKKSENNLDWELFNPFCFAGLNGSGKSNVLEALANIFYHLESCANVNQPQIFLDQFKPEFCKPNSFKLEYYIKYDKNKESSIDNLTRVIITKEVGEIPIMTHQPYPFAKVPINVTVVAVKNSKIPAEAKKHLPDLVIGYSSGENEILSIPFLKSRLLHYDEYRESVRKRERYYEPESNLIYIDYEMSQAVLLSNLIFQDSSVLKPLKDELKISGIQRFRMHLNHHAEGDSKLLDQYQAVLSAFKNCSTSYFEDRKGITMDFWVNVATSAAFKANFPDGIFQLFRAFQILYTLNYRTVTEKIKVDVYQSKGFYTDGKVPSPAPEDKVFYFLDYYIQKEDPITRKPIQLLMKNLSDGEQQFLHTLGICLMLKGKSSLLLLDEPETHFNPDWRSKFVRTLQKSLAASNSKNLMKEIIITSHSPFIISDCFPDKVIVFEKGKQPINAMDTNFRTYGTSVDIIMENIFKRNNTIGDLSREEIENILKEIETREFLSSVEVENFKRRTYHLGDSMEKILLFAKLNELESSNV